MVSLTLASTIKNVCMEANYLEAHFTEQYVTRLARRSFKYVY